MFALLNFGASSYGPLNILSLWAIDVYQADVCAVIMSVLVMIDHMTVSLVNQNL
jgi:hypothetical protein